MNEAEWDEHADSDWDFDFADEIDQLELSLMNDVELVSRLALNNVRRVLAVGRSIFTVTRRHVPRWIAGLLTVCLFIPGPLDEILVLLVIAVMVAFKPVMRADLASGIKEAWGA